MQKVRKPFSELKNGDSVEIHGKSLIVTNIRRRKNRKQIVEFTGICADEKINDDVRESPYNGATYASLETNLCTVNIGENNEN